MITRDIHCFDIQDRMWIERGIPSFLKLQIEGIISISYKSGVPRNEVVQNLLPCKILQGVNTVKIRIDRRRMRNKVHEQRIDSVRARQDALY